MSLEQHDVRPAALREVVGRRRAYDFTSYDYALGVLRDSTAAEASVHASQCSQCSVHDAAGWVGRLSAELLGSIVSGNYCTCRWLDRGRFLATRAQLQTHGSAFFELLAFASVLQAASPRSLNAFPAALTRGLRGFSPNSRLCDTPRHRA